MADKKKTKYTPTEVKLNIVEGTTRQILAQWTFTKDHVKEYQVRWYYLAGTQWIVGSDTTATGAEATKKQSTFTAPSNAIAVKVQIKPISTTYQKNIGSKKNPKYKTTEYWTGDWSTCNESTGDGYIYLGNAVSEEPDKPGTIYNLAVSQLTESSKTLVATWAWGEEIPDSGFNIEWEYQTSSNGPWVSGSSTTYKKLTSTYSASDYATAIRCRVKPSGYSWSDWVVWDASNFPPAVPSVPTVTIEKYTLKASVNYYGTNATQIDFEVVQDDSVVVVSSKVANIQTNYAAITADVAAGHTYKVRCRANNGDLRSAYSEYSSSVGTIPAAPGNFTVYRMASSSSAMSTARS